MTTPAAETVPYAPSALNRLYRAIERLPGGGWWVYPLLFVALLVYYEASLWATGNRPVGSLTLDGVAPLFYGPYILAASHYFTRIAGKAIDVFRPASGLDGADFALRRYALVTLPAGRIWIPLAIGVAIAIGSNLSASPAALAPYGGTVTTELVILGPPSLLGYGMLPVVIWQTVRQLGIVERLHREATALDLYDTGPIYAFSRFTVQIGIVFVFAGYYSLAANADFQAGNAVALSVIAGSIAMGAACFFLPLWGIHGRLVAEKANLVRGVNLRREVLQAELYRRVDASNLTGVKDVTDALGGVHTTRDQIARLPTWPWPPQVLRGFLSAILLPVLVFLLSRYVGGQVHLV